jgi:hypothetical protein
LELAAMSSVISESDESKIKSKRRLISLKELLVNSRATEVLPLRTEASYSIEECLRIREDRKD